jgi:hypothetical protein
MPLILGANSASGGYNVANSLRFNSGSSDNLSKVFASAETSNKIGTLSFWFKTLAVDQQYLVATNTGTIFYIFFNSSTGITFQNGATTTRFTTQVFRDPSAWYHLVVAWDTTQGTASNRQKMYLNGSQITAFSTSNDLSLNQVIPFFDNDGSTKHIGSYTGGGFYSGYISEFYGIDGQQLTPSSFGQTDPSVPSSGIWQPKAYTGSFGTNGFYLKFANSAALGTDSSGNGNNWTVNNLTSVDQSTDTPTNNFCTGNPLFAHNNTPTFSNGNLTIVTATGDSTVISTIGVTTGKWYFEAKIGSTAVGASIGILGDIESIQNTGSNLTFYPQGFAYYVDGRKYNNNVGSLYGDSYTTGDIIGVAFDLTNGKIWFSKNGTFQASGDPAAGTNAAFTTLSSTVTYFPAFGDASSGSTSTFDCNFGSPPFTISSGNADANGYGNFEYAVPSGFYALNTKNLAQYG